MIAAQVYLVDPKPDTMNAMTRKTCGAQLIISTRLFSVTLFVFACQLSIAQQPVTWVSEQATMLTLTKGEYPEVFENDTIREIGRCLFNTRTKQVTMVRTAGIMEDFLFSSDQSVSQAAKCNKPCVCPELNSAIETPSTGRWLSVDPLAVKYPDLSPYTFVNNNPIFFIDDDGRTFRIYFEVVDETTGVSAITYVDFNGTTATAADGSAYVMGTVPIVDHVVNSYNYIVENGADPTVNSGGNAVHVLQTMASSPTIINVQGTTGEDEYFSESGKANHRKILANTIMWNPELGLYVAPYRIQVEDENGTVGNSTSVEGYQSPAIGFLNEALDAYLDEFMTTEDKQLAGLTGGINTLNSGGLEDQWGVDRENEAIDRLREKGFFETKRKDEACYGCEDARMSTPTSTSPEER